MPDTACLKYKSKGGIALYLSLQNQRGRRTFHPNPVTPRDDSIGAKTKKMEKKAHFCVSPISAP